MGGSAVNLDPTQSSLFTGAGTPWAAGNKTDPMAYVGAGLADPMALISANVHDNITKPLASQLGFNISNDPTNQILNNQGLGLDWHATDRMNEENDYKKQQQQLANEQADRQLKLEKAKADQEAKALEARQKQAAEFGTNVESTRSKGGMLDAYAAARRAARKAKGRQLYGGML